MTALDLNNGSAHVRTYRNRRIGDFLKELHLTEGRCTGVPKIRKAMRANGSPPAIFKTDEEMQYFLTVIPIHPEASTGRLEEEKTPVEGEKTPVEGEKTPIGGWTGEGALPEELQILVVGLTKRTGQAELRLLIQKLCAWKPLTAQQLVTLLRRKDKKRFVRSYLTPMIKKGELKYVFPGGARSPNQAYYL